MANAIPVRLTIDDVAHVVALDPEPLIDYIQNNWPAVLDPKGDHGFKEKQLRTGLKSAIRIAVSNYVNPMAESAQYPKLTVDKSDDYISTALLYFVEMMLAVLSNAGGMVIEVHGDSVTRVAWSETDAAPSEPARSVGDLRDVGFGENDVRETAAGHAG